MNLYVIRHGQTNLNNEKRYNCRIDEDINEIGINQALEARKQIEKLDIDLIICSPMKRTKHTMEIINSNNIKTIYDDRLMERIGGKLTGEPLGDFYYMIFGIIILVQKLKA
jgi:alpha-ribazole phosphatase